MLDPGVVHHRADVEDPVVERARAEVAVGQARPPLVEGDHAAERAEPFGEAPERRKLERQLAVPDRARHHYDRPLAVTPPAVRDAQPVVATVVLVAQPGDRIVTSDPGDIERLAAAAGLSVVIVPC